MQECATSSRVFSTLTRQVQRLTGVFLFSMNSPHQRTANTRNEPVLSTLRGWELCGLSYDALGLGILQAGHAAALLSCVPRMTGCDPSTCMKAATRLSRLYDCHPEAGRSIHIAMDKLVDFIQPDVCQLGWGYLSSLTISTTHFDPSPSIVAFQMSVVSLILNKAAESSAASALSTGRDEAHDIATCIAALIKKPCGQPLRYQIEPVFVTKLIECNASSDTHPASYRDPSVVLSLCAWMDPAPPLALDAFAKAIIEHADEHSQRNIGRCLKPLSRLASRFPDRFSAFHAAIAAKYMVALPLADRPPMDELTWKKNSLSWHLERVTNLSSLTQGLTTLHAAPEQIDEAVKALLVTSLPLVSQMPLLDMELLCKVLRNACNPKQLQEKLITAAMIPPRVSESIASRCEELAAVSLGKSNGERLVRILKSLSYFCRQSPAACRSVNRIVGQLLNRRDVAGPLLVGVLQATARVFGGDARLSCALPPSTVDMLTSRLAEELHTDMAPSFVVDAVTALASLRSQLDYEDIRGFIERSISLLRPNVHHLTRGQDNEVRAALRALGHKQGFLVSRKSLVAQVIVEK